MATVINPLVKLFIAFFFLSALLVASGHSVPAIYTFGDSLVDVGNNNYVADSILKADFPHNGVDYPNGIATGRFSNGKNAADFLSEKVGLPTAPPYLSLMMNSSSGFNGVSFASGGAGILNGTNQLFYPIPLSQQVDFYSDLVQNHLVQQMGFVGAKAHLAKSLYLIVIGSNDLLSYFQKDSLVSSQYTPPQYVRLMLSTLQQLIKRLYGLGARKFVVTGVGMVGCCPVQRLQMNVTGACNAEANYWARKYNIGLRILLNKLKMQLSDINYSYFDTYLAITNLMRDPQTYGISEIKEACCGGGKLNAEMPCLPISTYCSNRNEYLFWDLYHPTETVSRMVGDLLYTGSRRFSFPMNVEYLVRI